MSLLSVSAIENTASADTNIILNADGSVTIGLYRLGTAPTPVQTGTLWYDQGGVSGTTGVVIWNGTAWEGVGTPFVAALGLDLTGDNLKVSIPVASTPPVAGALPAQAIDGSLYWDDTLGSLFIRYNNGGSSTWVQTSGQANVITTNATYYVATTGNDTTGNGSLAAPWATPQRAMEYLSAFTIKQGVSVTVSVADGSYTFTNPLNLNHPNGSQIFINGGTTTGVRPTTTLTGGNAVGNTGATLAANDALLNAYYNTKWQFNGCHGLICQTGGGVTVNTVLIRGNSTSPWSGVIAGNNTATTEFASAGSINLGPIVAVHNFSNGILTYKGGSIVATGATVTNIVGGGVITINGGSIWAPGVVTSNSGGGIIVSGGGSVQADSCFAFYNTGNGILINYGGSVIAPNATARNNGSNGITTNYGGSINVSSATASNNGVNGITTVLGGSINAASATASSNSLNGIATQYGGSINAPSATASNNGGIGLFGLNGGSINATSATVNSNGSSGGVVASGSSTIVFTNGTASNNTGYGIWCNSGGGFIDAGGSTSLGNTAGTNVQAQSMGNINFGGGNAAGLLSPAGNTVGNGNAFIVV